MWFEFSPQGSLLKLKTETKTQILYIALLEYSTIQSFCVITVRTCMLNYGMQKLENCSPSKKEDKEKEKKTETQHDPDAGRQVLYIPCSETQ